jgi:hypothetical protein
MSTWDSAHVVLWPLTGPTVLAPDDIRMMVIVEQSVQYELAGETEVLGENLSYCQFVHHKSHMTWPGPPRWEAGD